MNNNDETEPRAWVGCLACYNDGRLIGQWYEGAEIGEVTTEALHEVAANLSLDNSDPMNATHEELWVMDHEGFDGFLKGECSPVEAALIADFIGQIPSYVPTAAVAAWLENQGYDNFPADGWSQIGEDFSEAYAGEHDSDKDFAQDHAEEHDLVKHNAGWPHDCIDWDLAARDLMNDYWSDGRYYFRSV